MTKQILMAFSTEDKADRVVRKLAKSGYDATRDGTIVTTTEDGYYMYASLNLCGKLPSYESKQRCYHDQTS